MENMSVESAAREILERAKEIATIFDRCDGKTDDTNINISISESYIFVTAANHFDDEFHWLFKATYFREEGKLLELEVFDKKENRL